MSELPNNVQPTQEIIDFTQDREAVEWTCRAIRIFTRNIGMEWPISVQRDFLSRFLQMVEIINPNHYLNSVVVEVLDNGWLSTSWKSIDKLSRAMFEKDYIMYCLPHMRIYSPAMHKDIIFDMGNHMTLMESKPYKEYNLGDIEFNILGSNWSIEHYNEVSLLVAGSYILTDMDLAIKVARVWIE